MKLEGVFDTTGSLQAPRYGDLHREFKSALTYRPAMADVRDVPRGDGHTVLVIPGLLTTDAFTFDLRRYLAACGYKVEGWHMGYNWGPTPRILDGLTKRVTRLADRSGGPVSVIGVSMGGILARNLAHDHPGLIRKLATVVSPVRFPTASTLKPLIWALSPFYSKDVSAQDYSRPLQMPVMAIYTKEDGLVAWESCQGADDHCHHVEVEGGHVTICRNPQVQRALAEWLARKD
jgi:pimeloyl-ACP methyl ester carboxylesterase